jgi:hypothetical protein
MVQINSDSLEHNQRSPLSFRLPMNERVDAMSKNRRVPQPSEKSAGN